MKTKATKQDEIAVRFHHRLVAAHPFPNGNGRWSRLATDMLIVQLGGKRFNWGSANLQSEGEVRRGYIDALHAADNHDLEPLIEFARCKRPPIDRIRGHLTASCDIPILSKRPAFCPESHF